MASIMGFSIKSLKEENNHYECSLYYDRKKIGKVHKDDNFFIDFTKHGEKIKTFLYDKVEEYFSKYPKYIEEKYNEYGLAICELINDLIVLTKIEKQYIKSNETTKTLLIRLMYYDNSIYNEIKKEQIMNLVIDCIEWNKEHTKTFINIYKPISYIIYEDLNDFNIL